MVTVREVYVKQALSRSGLPEYDYSLNPYVGCMHGCIYCYAMDFTRGEPALRWGEVVYVKVNLISVLGREVRRLRPGIVGVSTITDPYQPIESKYKLTRRAVELLLRSGFRVSIQTKSALVVRDIDILTRYVDSVDVGFTITTMREGYRLIEPRAAHPAARAATLRRLSRLGIRTWIFLGPIIPGVNDKRADYEPVIRLAAETGSEVTIDRFRPRPMAASLMRTRLGEVALPSRDWWMSIVRDVKLLCGEYGVRCITADEEWAALRNTKARLGVDLG